MFILVFLAIFVSFLSLISLLRNNIIIWWRIFLIITLVFVFINKSSKSYRSLINYFIIQESLGLIFLLVNIGLLQFFIVIIKIGVAPLHFWIFRVTNGVFNYGLIWFLTFQKLPFLIILLQLFWLSGVVLLFVGLAICYLQMMVTKNYKNLLILSSTESFNWIILGLFISLLNPIYLFVYYILIIILLINKFLKLRENNLNWETVLVFLNLPFSVTFFVKIFSLREIFKGGNIFILLLLFIIFISALTFRYWLINIRIKNNISSQRENKFIYFILFPLIIIRIIYFSSKIYYIVLIRQSSFGRSKMKNRYYYI